MIYYASVLHSYFFYLNVMKKIILVAVVSILFTGCAWLTKENTQIQPSSTKTTQTQNNLITPKETDKTLGGSKMEIAGLSFTLPKGWSLLKVEKVSNTASDIDMAKIKVPDPKYNVIIPMTVFKNNQIVDVDKNVNILLRETSLGGKIYEQDCAPAIACYYLVYKGNTYDISFAEPESNEPMPENSEGPVFPSTTITSNDTLNFMATVK